MLQRRMVLLTAAAAALSSVAIGPRSFANPLREEESFICSTPQFTPYDRIRNLRDELVPFSYTPNGRVALRPLVAQGGGRAITMQDFQLALGSDAWRRSDGLPGSTSDRIRIGVHFLNGTSNQRAMVRFYAPLWTGSQGAPIEFVYDNMERAHIRISFRHRGDWSMIGRQARERTDRSRPTMSLEEADTSSSADRAMRVILHEFGHALGLRHEHQHPEAGIIWREDKVIEEMARQGWDENTTRRNVLDAYRNTSYRCIGSGNFDVESVMLYSIPQRWTLNDFRSPNNSMLFRGDEACAFGLYGGLR